MDALPLGRSDLCLGSFELHPGLSQDRCFDYTAGFQAPHLAVSRLPTVRFPGQRAGSGPGITAERAHGVSFARPWQGFGDDQACPLTERSRALAWAPSCTQVPACPALTPRG